MIQVHRSPAARSFLAEAGTFLTEREAEHNLLLGICSSLLREPSPFGQGPAYLAIIEDDDRVIGAALQEPRWLVLDDDDRARRLEEAGVDTFGLLLDQVKHRLDQPCRGEHLAVICDPLL